MQNLTNKGPLNINNYKIPEFGNSCSEKSKLNLYT